VALLFERERHATPDSRSTRGVDARLAPPDDAGRRTTRVGDAGVSVVVKVGGGLLAHPRHFEHVIAALESVSGASVLIVPGGGPFADAVRDADRRLRLGDDASHWMAILAMDQVAHLIVSRLTRGALVTDAAGSTAALAAGCLPVLAPFRWLRDADPLPHSWDVTSDSIAAWVAGAVGAARLGLIKPPGAVGPDCVDPQFARVVGAGLRVTVLPAGDTAALRQLLAPMSAGGDGGVPGSSHPTSLTADPGV
jgi:aspartokinase-like uncharacterized kinase